MRHRVLLYAVAAEQNMVDCGDHLEVQEREDYWEIRREIALPFQPHEGLCLGSLFPEVSESYLRGLTFDVARERWEARLARGRAGDVSEHYDVFHPSFETTKEAIEEALPGWTAFKWIDTGEDEPIHTEWPPHLSMIQEICSSGGP